VSAWGRGGGVMRFVSRRRGVGGDGGGGEGRGVRVKGKGD